jgi:hypothetical protein
MINDKREKLPGGYENRYKSENLKALIADEGMWTFIPAVEGIMDSPKGIRRLKENDLLFSFIDHWFPDSPFAFEPNMQDGRFMLLPEDVGHQGIGICVSKDLPGFLETGNFWYPCEFTEKKIAFGPGQVYVPAFSQKPEEPLADMVRAVYMEQKKPKQHDYCTFLYAPDIVITLEGYFLDHLDQSEKKIRSALRNTDPQVQRNGEGLIHFMHWVMNS